MKRNKILEADAMHHSNKFCHPHTVTNSSSCSNSSIATHRASSSCKYMAGIYRNILVRRPVASVQYNSFRSVVSKGFPSGYSKRVCLRVCARVCVRMLSEKSEPTRWFSQMTPDEHPRRHRLADGQLPSLCAPIPSFSPFTPPL